MRITFIFFSLFSLPVKTGAPQSASVTITVMDDAKALSMPVSINVDY